jgi:hypothetical protein
MQGIVVGLYAEWFFQYASADDWRTVGEDRAEAVDAYDAALRVQGQNRPLWMTPDEVMAGPGAPFFVWFATSKEWDAVGAARSAAAVTVPY